MRTLRPDLIMEGIEGGPLVAARSTNALCFFDWETGSLIRRIEISAKHVYWSDSGEMVNFETVHFTWFADLCFSFSFFD